MEEVVDIVAFPAATHVKLVTPKPPEELTMAEPVQAPGQLILVIVGVIAIEAGCVIVKATVFVHWAPLFCIVTVCVPAHKPEATLVAEPAGLHIYVYGVTPPLTETEAVASHEPKHDTLVCVGVTVTAVG